MAFFEPVVVLFGSSKTISTIHFRLPVSFVFAIDEVSLEELISLDPQLSDSCLQRYFVILLQPVKEDVFDRLQANHRVQGIYIREALTGASNQTKPCRIINKQLQQFTLDLTSDIVQFLTIEGEKQVKLERVHLTRIYYRQARLLKEWAMSFVKAEPCHILVIPLNTSQENVNSAVERIQKLCTKLGHPSVIIRILDEYIPSTEDKRACLLPYTDILFNYEHPEYICELIKKLSPLRLYLYGNEECIPSGWSNLMINHETEVMEDEDSWCAFIENEYIDDEMKWNIGPMFGGKWQVKRLAPINLTELDKNLRFQSALCRAYKTLSSRQTETTSEIFDWYDRCLREGYLQLEPQMMIEEFKDKTGNRKTSDATNRRIPTPSSIHYPRISDFKEISFIWLDEMLNSSNDYLNQIIKPFAWHFFDNVSQCLPFIEHQLREQNQIFLVASGALGYDLFISSYRLMSIIPFVYIYCSRLGLHGNWVRYYSQVQGVFNDSLTLGKKIKEDLERVHHAKAQGSQTWLAQLPPAPRQPVFLNPIDDQTAISVPIIVYNQEQAHAFISHQRTIDTLLCLPYTEESRAEMIEEFRRLYAADLTTLIDIDQFNENYHSNGALQWYTRDSFLFRAINRALRSSDVEMMFKMRYFLIDLYAQLDVLYKQNPTLTSEQLYRGQIMLRDEYEYFQQLTGDIISISTFFSTTTSLQVALTFANASTSNADYLPIIFCIETNPYIQQKRPYANISRFSLYVDEEEVLFAMGSLFRVERLDRLDQIPIIHLNMVDQSVIDNNQTV